MASAGSVGAQVLYPSPTALDSPGQPDRVVVGDFNSDGRADIVANNPVGGRIVFHLGGGNLTFASRLSIFVGGQPSGLAVADMDGDGVDDLVWTDGATGKVGILYTRGANPVSFVPLSIAGDDEAVALALFDRDGDGRPDVVVAHRGADSIRWYRNTGDGLSAWDRLEVGDGPASLVVIPAAPLGPMLAVSQQGFLARDVVLLDVDTANPVGRIPQSQPGMVTAYDLFGDAVDELLITDAGSGRIGILGQNAGQWSEVASVQGEVGSVATRRIASATAENRLLVAEASRNRLRIWSDGDGSGVFTSLGSWYVGSKVEDFTLHDLNGDGAQEVVVPLPDFDAVKIVRTAGDGLLTPRADLTAALPIRLERDGSVDEAGRVAVLGLGAREVWVYRLARPLLELDAIVSAPPSAKEIALADLDGQDESDLLVLDGATGVWRALASPGNGFAPLTLVAPVVGGEDFEVASLVGGPALDLAVGDPSIPGLRIFEGDGAGNFSFHSTLTTDENVFVVRTKDLDLDGDLELVTLGEVDDLVIFYGNGAGFGNGVTLRVGATPRDLVFGRFNQDAYPDIVATSAGISVFSIVNSVFSGFYSVATRTAPALFGAQNCEAFDVDGDGYDDLFTSGPGASQLALYFATGDPALGTFTPVPNTVSVTVAPLDIRAVQLDGDGVADLLVLDHFSGVIASLRSDPLGDLPAVQATISGAWREGRVELVVNATARQTNEIQLTRVSDRRILALSAVEAGIWSAVDASPSPAGESYVVRDLRGTELDRVAVMPGEPEVTSATTEVAALLPPTRAGDAVEFRFRLPGNPHPVVRVYDLRGRLVADLDSAPGEDRWFTARWDTRDRAGRRAARARYLVRVQGAGESLVTSVVLR